MVIIKRIELIKVINKFYLNGLIDDAEIHFKQGKATINFINRTKNLKGKIDLQDVECSLTGRIGLHNPRTFLSFIESFICLAPKFDNVILEPVKQRVVDQSIQKLKISMVEDESHRNSKFVIDNRSRYIFGMRLQSIGKVYETINLKTLWHSKRLKNSSVRDLLKGCRIQGRYNSNFCIKQSANDIEFIIKESHNSVTSPDNVDQISVPFAGNLKENFDVTKSFSTKMLKQVLAANNSASHFLITVLEKGYLKLSFKEENVLSEYLFR